MVRKKTLPVVDKSDAPRQVAIDPQLKWANELADMVELLMISCQDDKSWHEAKDLLQQFYEEFPPVSG